MKKLLAILGRWPDRCFRRTTLIIFGSSAFLGGVLYASTGSASWQHLLPALFFFPVLKSKNLTALIVLIYGCFIGGILRGQAAIASELPLRNYLGQSITVDAVITDDSYYDSRKRVTFSAKTYEMLSPDKRELSVPIRVNTFVLSSAMRGDVVRVSGKVYPTLGNVAGSIGYAEVETIGTTANLLDRLRQNFATGLRNTLPEPNASLASGITIGQSSSLTQRWEDILRDAGLTHIIVASGYNLTILVRVIRRGMKRFGSRYQILLISSAAVGCFVAIAGVSPSMLRAAIVVAIMQLSWYYGRKAHPLVILKLSAAISVLIDPFQLWRSVGWYLSFAAFFGVIVLAPLLIPKRFEKSFIVPLVVESFAAGIMTLPIIASVFGRVSIVSLLANVLVSPVVPASMAFSAVAGVAGWLAPEVGAWLALPAKWLLTYILDIANIVSRLPGARVSLSLNPWQLAIVYGIICVFIWILYKRRRPKAFVLE